MDSRCRIPQFHTGPKQILKKAGYKFNIFAWGGRSQEEMLRDLQKINPRLTMFKWKLVQLWGIIKLTYIEWLEDFTNEVRARVFDDEKEKADDLLKESLDLIDKAQKLSELRKIKKQIMRKAGKIKKTNKKLPIVFIVGDLYKVIQPELNNHVFKKLGLENIIPKRSFYLSHLLRQAGKIGPWGKKSLKKRKKPALKYLSKELSPGNLESMGDVLRSLEKDDVQGIIHVYSFTCMPENVTSGIYKRIAQEHKIPYLGFVTGENETVTQQNTRIEAFIDLIKRKPTSQKTQ